MTLEIINKEGGFHMARMKKGAKYIKTLNNKDKNTLECISKTGWI